MSMKTLLCICLYVWLSSPASGQQTGHYGLISANEAIQGDGYVASIMSWDRQKVELTVEKKIGIPVAVRLLTMERQVLFSDSVGWLDQLYRRVLNVSQLELGRYWLEIQVGKQLIRRELLIEPTEQTYRSLTIRK